MSGASRQSLSVTGVTDLDLIVRARYLCECRRRPLSVVRGQSQVAVLVVVAVTVARRTEGVFLAVASDGSFLFAYLQRLRDVLCTLAGWERET